MRFLLINKNARMLVLLTCLLGAGAPLQARSKMLILMGSSMLGYAGRQVAKAVALYSLKKKTESVAQQTYKKVRDQIHPTVANAFEWVGGYCAKPASSVYNYCVSRYFGPSLSMVIAEQLPLGLFGLFLMRQGGAFR